MTANLLTVPQAAKRLKLTPIRVRQFCQQGRLGAMIGNQYLITEAELKRFAKKPRRPGNPNLRKKRKR